MIMNIEIKKLQKQIADDVEQELKRQDYYKRMGMEQMFALSLGKVQYANAIDSALSNLLLRHIEYNVTNDFTIGKVLYEDDPEATEECRTGFVPVLVR